MEAEMTAYFAEIVLAAGTHEELSVETPAMIMDRLVQLEE